jgi:hypothetical protein
MSYCKFRASNKLVLRVFQKPWRLIDKGSLWHDMGRGRARYAADLLVL